MPIDSKGCVLVTGGAGYIGSHMVYCLEQAGYLPIVLDNLSTGHRDAVRHAELIVGDIHDTALLEQLFASYDFTAVMHFAGLIQVNESVVDPLKYYQNNVAGTINLLNVMLKANVKHFIFSSSAAVYGEPQYTPLDEHHSLLPINPYGQSKLMVENILQDFSKSYDLKFIALRYFNAAGADPSVGLAERHDPETHLIPLVLQVARGERDSFTIYGNDYATPDGTCVRDYVHVKDICHAHLLALQALLEGKDSCIYNLGAGFGFSVQQVIDEVCKVTGKNIPHVVGSRRLGDPAVLVADASRIMQDLGWKARHSALKVIIENAWKSNLSLSLSQHSNLIESDIR
jgi:UDP-glucose 4-epimerase